jgi:peptidoglycan/LPS O-acetylase OafA/YrhL
MRIYSFVFHIFLGVVMMAVGLVSGTGGQHNLQIRFLPWQGTTLRYCLLGLGFAALVITALAVRRVVPALFALWSLAVLVMLVRGYFFSSYSFGLGGIRTALLFVAAALLAFVGAALQALPKRATARRESALA